MSNTLGQQQHVFFILATMLFSPSMTPVLFVPPSAAPVVMFSSPLLGCCVLPFKTHWLLTQLYAELHEGLPYVHPSFRTHSLFVQVSFELHEGLL
jgi:hypothetical protein